MGFVPKWSRGNQKKTAPSSAQQGVRQMPSLFHGAKDAQFSAPNLFADGGEVSEEVLKSEGLKASQGEDVGFFKRLAMGNIDDPSSEAYKRFGAGRGRSMRSEAEANAREEGRNAEMTRLMNQAKEEANEVKVTPLPEPEPIVARPIRPARAAAPKQVSKPVDYSTAEDESPAETARLARAAKPAAVSPRPKMNWSTPADRARWDEKYKATHNEDGTPK